MRSLKLCRNLFNTDSPDRSNAPLSSGNVWKFYCWERVVIIQSLYGLKLKLHWGKLSPFSGTRLVKLCKRWVWCKDNNSVSLPIFKNPWRKDNKKQWLNLKVDNSSPLHQSMPCRIQPWLSAWYLYSLYSTFSNTVIGWWNSNRSRTWSVSSLRWAVSRRNHWWTLCRLSSVLWKNAWLRTTIWRSY